MNRHPGYPDTAVGRSNQGYCNFTLYVDVRSRVEWCYHFFAKWLDMRLSVASTSTPRRTSIDTTNREKWRSCRRQDSRQFFFFYFPVVFRNFYCDLYWWKRASVFTTRMSWILSIPIRNRLRMRRYPFYSDVSVSTGRLLRCDPRGWSFTSRTAWTLCMRGLLRMYEG